MAGVGEAAGATPISASGSLDVASAGPELLEAARFAATSAFGAPTALIGRSRLTMAKRVAASPIINNTAARPTTPTLTRCIV